MNLTRVMLIVGGVAMPVAMYLSGCSSTATTPGFGNTDGGKSSSSSGSSSSSSGGNGSSSGGGTSSSGGGTSSSGGGTSSSGSGSGGTSSSGSSSGTQTDAQCDAMSSGQACFDCCATNHMTGYNTAQTALTGCECGSGGKCQSQCSTEFCANPPANTTTGDACDTCLNNTLDPDAGNGCYNAFATACSADPDCIALYGSPGCASGCPNTP